MLLPPSFPESAETFAVQHGVKKQEFRFFAFSDRFRISKAHPPGLKKAKTKRLYARARLYAPVFKNIILFFASFVNKKRSVCLLSGCEILPFSLLVRIFYECSHS